MINWKTNSSGIALLLISLVRVVQQIVEGKSPDMVDVTAIVSGVGLMFAKDHNVTGGTTVQPSTPEPPKE